MAARNYITLESGSYKRRASDTDTVDFTAVRIGSSNLPITEVSNNLAFGSVRLTSVADPTSAQDVATKAYADSIAAGFDPKQSCLYATTAALPAVTAAGSGVGKTLTADGNGALAVDSAAPQNGDRVLIKNQVAGADNGIYNVTDLGSAGTPFIMTRAADFNQDVEVTNGARTLITSGTVNANQAWALTTADPVIVDTTAMTFTQVSGDVTEATSGSGGAIKGISTADSDKGLLITSGVMEVRLSAAGAIEFSSGELALNLEASNPSLQIAANELGVKLDGSGAITKGASGVGVNVGNTTEISANALEVKLADSTLSSSASGIAVDFTEDFTNDNASPITIRQVVYMKADGDVDLAQANGSFSIATKFGMVSDASIAAAASGAITVRSGRRVIGFAGLTIGDPVYIDRSTAGGTVQALTGFVAGEHIVRLGFAITATIIEWDPRYIAEF